MKNYHKKWLKRDICPQNVRIMKRLKRYWPFRQQENKYQKEVDSLKFKIDNMLTREELEQIDQELKEHLK